ncbi:Methyltranfer-dom domain-containing protein [Mycena chlorophos]|uniref:Methyltranfer-dom domain-containing protein n=1 Tax=Mycena chlorophos TaxID=658473 RepID=A0A8H6SCN4_MYCCL|nr:Methyltranfer-dom domain-containing protein [Mycena chlorophos]
MTLLPNIHEHIPDALNLLQSPLVHELLATHPNDIPLHSEISTDSLGFLAQKRWTDWAADNGADHQSGEQEKAPWMRLLAYYLGKSKGRDSEYEEDIPAALRSLVDQLISHSLPRKCTIHPVSTAPEISIVGLSPKKAHEVRQCVTYLSSTLPSVLGPQRRQLHIVDVGAGQGYLTRALQKHLSTSYDVRLLALDSNEVQTSGATRWDARLSQRGSKIAHKTIHITPETLLTAVDEWVAEEEHEEEPLVLFVALHACGSLTPDIFRAFFTRPRRSTWTPFGVLAVGCCYNLLAPGDFPLSQRVQSLATAIARTLPGSAYQLAAQIPAEWTRNSRTWADTKLAVRKVVWRAIIGGRLASFEPPPSQDLSQNGDASRSPPVSANPDGTPGEGSGDRPAMRRLGRLNDAVYKDWRVFASKAAERMAAATGDHVNFTPGRPRSDFVSPSTAASTKPLLPSSVSLSNATANDDHESNELKHTLSADLTLAEHAFANRIGVLHVLRCLVGPLVESVIVGDRAVWMCEQMGWDGSDPELIPGIDLDITNDSQWLESERRLPRPWARMEAINLFDQATGSGRNIALAVFAERRLAPAMSS